METVMAGTAGGAGEGGAWTAARPLATLVDGASTLPLFAARLVAAALGDAEHGLRELANRVRAYERFVAAPDLGPSRLAAAVAGLDDWEATWVKEGIGYRWGLRRVAPLDLRDGSDVPPGWRLPLLTGFGLGLAVRELDALSWRAGGGEVAATVGRFLERAAAAAAEGWRLAVVEALGLAAETLHPHRLAALDAALAAAGGEARHAFWHGVGRGRYFAPTAALPFLAGSPAARLADLAASAPDGEAAEQAVGGWAWALALVNLRHPEVVAAALVRRVEPLAAFADGVACASVVWRACGGGERTVERFLAHRPAEATAAAGWRAVVAECEAALARPPAPDRPLGALFVARAGRRAEVTTGTTASR